MKPYLFESVNRVPLITDEEIAAMRRIEPVLKDGSMYRRIVGADTMMVCGQEVQFASGSIGHYLVKKELFK